jgi:sn-glycerol 3-phosphate transport system permease protein
MRPRRTTAIATHITLTVITFLFLVPVLYAAIKATQDRGQALSTSLMPGNDLLVNLEAVWSTFGLGTAMWNTILVTAAVTLGKTVLSFLAAAAFVYFRFPLQGPAFVLVLFTLMMPTEILIIALFDLVNVLGIFNSLQGVIWPFLASATGTFLFRQHFLRIPRDIVEACQVDGAGPLRFIRSVLVPLSWNTIGALAVIDVVYVWNMYLWPFINLQEPSNQMMQVRLVAMLTEGDTNHYGIIMAGAVLTMIPVLIIFMLLQERFTRGFALSGDK